MKYGLAYRLDGEGPWIDDGGRTERIRDLEVRAAELKRYFDRDLPRGMTRMEYFILPETEMRPEWRL